MLRISSRAEVVAVIGGGWKVLDVGSGDQPFPLATTLLDRLPRRVEDGDKVSTENPTMSVTRDGRPFVIGDLEELPFADQSFDFVYASHIIEHAADPEKALAELARVAPRGYIECPRAWYEFIDSSPFHQWLIDVVDGELQFRAKSDVEARFMAIRRLFDADQRLFAGFYGQVFESVDPGGVSIEKSMCHVCVYWEETIPCRLLSPAVYLGS